MAGDIRDTSAPSNSELRGPPPGATEVPEHVKTPNKIYEVFNGPPPSANALPDGSGQNTAGAHVKPVPSLTDAVKTVRWQDIMQVPGYPCARESLMMGIGGGFGMGGIRALWGAPVPKVANWAVGTFVLAAVANYEYCIYKRSLEKAGMKRAVDILDRKKAEKEAREAAAKIKREERRRVKEEEDKRAEEAAAKRWSWKFW